MALESQTNGEAKLPSCGTQTYLDPEITERYKSQDTKKSWFRTGVSGGVGKRAHKIAMHKLVHINKRVVIKETYNPSSKLHQSHMSMARDVAQWVTLVQVPRTCVKAGLGTCVSVSSVMGSRQRWLAGRQSRSRFSKSLIRWRVLEQDTSCPMASQFMHIGTYSCTQTCIQWTCTKSSESWEESELTIGSNGITRKI